MKKLILVLIASTLASSGYSIDNENRADDASAEQQRRTIVRELRDIGFDVREHHGKTTILEYGNEDRGYYYQICISTGKRRVALSGYAFMKPEYTWSFRVAADQAIDHLERILRYAARIRDGRDYLSSYIF